MTPILASVAGRETNAFSRPVKAASGLEASCSGPPTRDQMRRTAAHAVLRRGSLEMRHDAHGRMFREAEVSRYCRVDDAGVRLNAPRAARVALLGSASAVLTLGVVAHEDDGRGAACEQPGP